MQSSTPSGKKGQRKPKIPNRKMTDHAVPNIHERRSTIDTAFVDFSVSAFTDLVKRRMSQKNPTRAVKILFGKRALSAKVLAQDRVVLSQIAASSPERMKRPKRPKEFFSRIQPILPDKINPNDKYDIVSILTGLNLVKKEKGYNLPPRRAASRGRPSTVEAVDDDRGGIRSLYHNTGLEAQIRSRLQTPSIFSAIVKTLYGNGSLTEYYVFILKVSNRVIKEGRDDSTLQSLNKLSRAVVGTEHDQKHNNNRSDPDLTKTQDLHDRQVRAIAKELAAKVATDPNSAYSRRQLVTVLILAILTKIGTMQKTRA